jgi:hypothetical protein
LLCSNVLEYVTKRLDLKAYGLDQGELLNSGLWEEREEEERLKDIMEGDVQASAQPSTLIDTPTPLLLHTPALSTVRIRAFYYQGTPNKQPIILSRKRGRGH